MLCFHIRCYLIVRHPSNLHIAVTLQYVGYKISVGYKIQFLSLLPVTKWIKKPCKSSYFTIQSEKKERRKSGLDSTIITFCYIYFFFGGGGGLECVGHPFAHEDQFDFEDSEIIVFLLLRHFCQGQFLLPFTEKFPFLAWGKPLSLAGIKPFTKWNDIFS
jgi:hypothetical protein